MELKRGKQADHAPRHLLCRNCEAVVLSDRRVSQNVEATSGPRQNPAPVQPQKTLPRNPPRLDIPRPHDPLSPRDLQYLLRCRSHVAFHR